MAKNKIAKGIGSQSVKIDRGFPVQVATALGVGGGIAAYPLSRYGSAEIIEAAIVGALLSTANVLLGYLAIEFSFEKSYTTFLKAVLGGMGIRMLGMLGMLVMLIKVFGFHATALVISLLGFYVIFLILEILFIQKKVILKNQG
ncbi:MAG: hypothetical protein HW407_675 [Bacteroidetes bacterium]|nr:hypothetical protein [Bacteroidota bacterium]